MSTAIRWRWFRLDGREIDAPGCDWCGCTFERGDRALFSSDGVVCSERCARQFDAPREQPKRALVCSWCSSVIEDGAGPASHGICGPCGSKARQQQPAPVTL